MTSRGKLLVGLAVINEAQQQINDNDSHTPHNIQSSDVVIISNNNNYYNAPDEDILNAVLHSNAKNFSEEDIINAEFLYRNDDLTDAAKDKGEYNNIEINNDKIDSEENVMDADYPNDDLIIATANDKGAHINEKDTLSQDSYNNNNSISIEENKDIIVDMNFDDASRNNIYTEENNDIESENNVNFPVPEDSTRQERKRSKRQHVNENTWNVKKQKINREKGVGYKGKTKVDGKYYYNTNKSERKLKPRCKYSSNKKTPMKCFNFNDNDRQNIFSSFWNKSWAEKKVYVQLLTEANPITRARDRKDDTVSRRGCSFKYFLNKNDERLRVCKTFFLHTLDVGEWSVREWKQKALTSGESCDSNNGENSKKSSVRRDLFANRNLSLKHFFDSLVKVESHYCRASSKKLYLEPLWKSKNSLYNFYVEDWCKSKNEIPLSIGAFNFAFENENLSLYAPKKDLCDLCVAYDTKNLPEEDFRLHQLKKEEARQEKNRDKENEPNVFTMDLQSVLLSPRSNVSSMYYKTKLAVHNFTLYNLKSKDGYCFLWNETEGNLTAQEFSSIICKFILSLLPMDGNNSILKNE